MTRQIDASAPGLLRQLTADYMAMAPYPHITIASVTALATLAGMCGRALSVGGNGLALYSVILAPTGTGKNATKLAESLFDPDSTDEDERARARRYGSSSMASAMALMQSVSTQPCRLWLSTEFGLQLSQWLRPDSPQSEIPSFLLDMYTANRPGGRFAGREYKKSSDNIPPVKRPALSFLGECTPETFFAAVSIQQLEMGLLSRCFIVEASMLRKYNDNHCDASISELTRWALNRVWALCATLEAGGEMAPIRWGDDAIEAMRARRAETDSIVTTSKNDIVRMLATRKIEIMQRIAGLFAVSEWAETELDETGLMLTSSHIELAFALVDEVHKNLATRFHLELRGNSPEGQQLGDLREQLSRVAERPVCRDGIPRALFDFCEQNNIHAFTRRRAQQLANKRSSFNKSQHEARDFRDRWNDLCANREVLPVVIPKDLKNERLPAIFTYEPETPARQRFPAPRNT